MPKGLPHCPLEDTVAQEQAWKRLEAMSDSTGSVSLLHSTITSAEEWSTWALPATATS